MAATIAQAIQALVPGAVFSMLDGNDYNTINWVSPPGGQPTQQQVLAEQAYLDSQIPINNCKETATQLLYQTDWTTIADVADPAKSNPYLMNQAEFTAYRSALRQLAVYPVANPVWPTKPAEQWSASQ
jgi:hypothetical protein